MKKLIFEIPNMQSTHCQLRVRNTLQAIAGVAIDSIAPGVAEVDIQSASLQNAVTEAIQKAGYTVASMQDVSMSAPASAAIWTFKTNIQCGGCLAQVTPLLDATAGNGQWEVDTNSPDKILFVQAEGLTQEAIEQSVQEAGFKIERITL